MRAIVWRVLNTIWYVISTIPVQTNIMAKTRKEYGE
jgi:hypothetical protein